MDHSCGRNSQEEREMPGVLLLVADAFRGGGSRVVGTVLMVSSVSMAALVGGGGLATASGISHSIVFKESRLGVS